MGTVEFTDPTAQSCASVAARASDPMVRAVFSDLAVTYQHWADIGFDPELGFKLSRDRSRGPRSGDGPVDL